MNWDLWSQLNQNLTFLFLVLELPLRAQTTPTRQLWFLGFESNFYSFLLGHLHLQIEELQYLIKYHFVETVYVTMICESLSTHPHYRCMGTSFPTTNDFSSYSKKKRLFFSSYIQSLSTVYLSWNIHKCVIPLYYIRCVVEVCNCAINIFAGQGTDDIR